MFNLVPYIAASRLSSSFALPPILTLHPRRKIPCSPSSSSP
jgi:hypothetical protein